MNRVTFKNAALAAVAALMAFAASDASAYGVCPPQPLAKKTYTPVLSQNISLQKDSNATVFGRRNGSTLGTLVGTRSQTRPTTEITVGSTVTAPARFLGNEMGCVFLQVGPAVLECDIVAWSPTSVTFVVPNMGLGPITAGKLQIVRGDGDIIREYPACLIRKPDLIEHESPAPTSVHVVETLPQS